jgi:competence protein CoiA
MQLYAYDENEKVIEANQALKQKDYRCLECQGTVRKRSGNHRKSHFYHLKESNCRLSNKTLVHLQVQHHIQSLLPEVHLEYRFPKISRIADVAWIDQKIIFEIQFSPITKEEVQKRNLDYASLGFVVVWILHDRRFNQRKMTAAENFLQNFPHYFTNINKEGEGIIYDQLDCINFGIRNKYSKSLPIFLNKPYKSKDVPIFFKRRVLYFEDDLLDLYLKKNLNPAEIKIIEEVKKDRTLFKKLLHKTLLSPYRIVFKILLEKFCR